MIQLDIFDGDIKDGILILNDYIKSIFLTISMVEKLKKICVNCKKLVIIHNRTTSEMKIGEISGSIKILEIIGNISIEKCIYIDQLILKSSSKKSLIDYKNILYTTKKLDYTIENKTQIDNLFIKGLEYFKGKTLDVKSFIEIEALDFSPNTKLKNLSINSNYSIIKLIGIPKKLSVLSGTKFVPENLNLDNILILGIATRVLKDCYHDFTQEEASRYCEEKIINNNLDYYLIHNKQKLDIENSNFFLINRNSIKIFDKFKYAFNGYHGMSDNYIYPTLNLLKRIALITCDSRYLKNYPEFVYSISNRPKTDMSMFRVSDSLTIDEYQIIKKDGWKLIPVTRYADSQMGSHYHDKYKGCGTFYYLEKQSETMLTFKTYLIAETKYLIYIKLLKLSGKTDEESIKETDKIANSDSFSELMFDYSRDPKNTYERLLEIKEKDPNRYEETYQNLYGYEDVFDGPLCYLANQLNIDILILTYMVGSQNKKVEELYDVRDRLDSFRSLVFDFKLSEESWKLNEDLIYEMN